MCGSTTIYTLWAWPPAHGACTAPADRIQSPTAEDISADFLFVYIEVKPVKA